MPFYYDIKNVTSYANCQWILAVIETFRKPMLRKCFRRTNTTIYLLAIVDGQSLGCDTNLLCPTFYGHMCVIGNWRVANAPNGYGTTGAAAYQGHHNIILWSVWRPPTKVQRNISQFRTTIRSPVKRGEGGWAIDSTTSAAADEFTVYDPYHGHTVIMVITSERHYILLVIPETAEALSHRIL